MKNLLYVLLLLLVSACKSVLPTHKEYTSETLKIIQITENTFQHVSYLNVAGLGKYPCNGMVYLHENEAIIFDTPTNNRASAELIEWIGKKRLKAVVITHFHDDCLGGLEQFHEEGIPSYANHTTIKLAKTNNEILPQNSFDKKMVFDIGGDEVRAEFFGQGHTVDNVVGYVPSKKTLFGGCLVKQLNASKGNLKDANTVVWSSTVENIIAEIPELEIVVPGHGDYGGVELLVYTAKLFGSE